MRKELDLALATRLINHGPVVLVSSSHGDKVNITTVAWNMPVQKKPPMIVLEISEKHFIYECIMETGDFAVNIPGKALSEELVKCGSVSGRDADKFQMCGLTAEPGKAIKSPVLKEALAVLECSLVKDEHLLKEYNMVVGQVKHAEVEEGAFDEHWLFDKDEARTVHHLGDKTFCFPGGGVIDLRK
jgi:flavin reductase (DIM6/NTAB) family NADH-FMN oxidoreductase RutF